MRISLDDDSASRQLTSILRRAGVGHRGAGSRLGSMAPAFLRPRPPLVQPAGATRARSLTPQITLCAIAYHKAIALTFSAPRTSRRTNPRLRACALTHSAVAARSL